MMGWLGVGEGQAAGVQVDSEIETGGLASQVYDRCLPLGQKALVGQAPVCFPVF